MNQANYHNWNQMQESAADSATLTKTFMAQVFGWMSGALIITALSSYLFAFVPSLTEMVYNYYKGEPAGLTILGWIIMLSPIAFVILIVSGVNRLPFPLLIGAFLLYSALTGASLSVIFFRYEMASIGATFFIAAGMFATMAVMGWITKADLSGFGRIMMMGLVGIVIASVVNFFLQSDGLHYIISFVGVAVFTGLTAYDVQKLKNIGAGQSNSDTAARQSILGALTLYLDFINLFLFLLRLMGNRK